MVTKRGVHAINWKNYVVPDGEGCYDVIKHLDTLRPTYTLLYFTASWNPICKQIERDYENLTAEYAQFHHIRVDCDVSPKVKRYFDARVEPQFLVLINGGEITRVTGYNFDKLVMTLEKV